MTSGKGVDVTIEAVGMAASFGIRQEIVGCGALETNLRRANAKIR
jgi:hypothetical protein